MNKHFVIFNVATGEAVSFGRCQECDFDSQARGDPNLAIFEMDASDETHYLKSGNVFAYTAEEVAKKKAHPDYSDKWSNESMSWVDPRTLVHFQMAKWSAIKAHRNRIEFSNFDALNYVFDGDALSQTKIQGAVQLASLSLMAGGSFQIDWTLADNAVVILSAQDMIAVGQALAVKIQSVYNTARQLRQQIDQAQTKEEIEAIGWPE